MVDSKEIKTVWFTPELLAIAKQTMYMSPSTWHKIMNPYCPSCLIERGKNVSSTWRNNFN